MLICSTAVLSAQDMTSWNWSEFDITFSIPSDFYVSQNDDTLFAANSSDNQFSVEISPWSDGSFSADEVAYAALGEAEENWSDIEVVDEDWIESGYDSYYIIGSAVKNGSVLNYLIVGVINSDNDDNVYVRYSWWESEYDSYYAELAMEITSTFE